MYPQAVVCYGNMDRKNTDYQPTAMKSKKESEGSKVIPIKKPNNEISFEKRVKEFTKHQNNPDEFNKIFTVLTPYFSR
jgi:hypothetical protein